MHFPLAYFITWTTYGTWLPGDARAWKKWRAGHQPPQPRLEAWCQTLMKERALTLSPAQRLRIEDVCRQHADIRNWQMHAMSVRSNHVHLVVSAAADPQKVRDQFKANATRVLRQPPHAIEQEHIWTRGGDIEFIDRESDLALVALYVTEAQDRKHREQ